MWLQHHDACMMQAPCMACSMQLCTMHHAPLKDMGRAQPNMLLVEPSESRRYTCITHATSMQHIRHPCNILATCSICNMQHGNIFLQVSVHLFPDRARQEVDLSTMGMHHTFNTRH